MMLASGSFMMGRWASAWPGGQSESSQALRSQKRDSDDPGRNIRIARGDCGRVIFMVFIYICESQLGYFSRRRSRWCCTAEGQNLSNTLPTSFCDEIHPEGL